MYNDKRYKVTERITTKGTAQTKHLMRKNLPTITTTIVLLYYVHISKCPNVHMSIYVHMSICPYGHRDIWTYEHMDIRTYGHLDIWTCEHVDMWTFRHIAPLSGKLFSYCYYNDFLNGNYILK